MMPGRRTCKSSVGHLHYSGYGEDRCVSSKIHRSTDLTGISGLSLSLPWAASTTGSGVGSGSGCGSGSGSGAGAGAGSGSAGAAFAFPPFRRRVAGCFFALLARPVLSRHQCCAVRCCCTTCKTACCCTVLTGGGCAIGLRGVVLLLRTRAARCGAAGGRSRPTCVATPVRAAHIAQAEQGWGGGSPASITPRPMGVRPSPAGNGAPSHTPAR